MEQNFYPFLAPSAHYDNDVVESMINKQLANVFSFNNSIQNIMMMMKYYQLEEKKFSKNTQNTC